jgi:AraC-like DNA-binding protein
MNSLINTAFNPLVATLRRSGLLAEDLDYHIVRASMVIMFFFFGYQKWWAYEAERLVPFISNGPLIWWLYPVFGHQGASWFLGVSEWTFGSLLFAGFWDKRSENAGTGERLDLLCGHFAVAPPHDRLLRNYLPPLLVVHSGDTSASTAHMGTAAQLSSLVGLMRSESEADHLGGRAMLNALSTAMFALVLRLASEAKDAPIGLLAVASNPRLAPALAAIFNEPARAWSLPELARLCNMSRATLARQFQEKLGRSATDLLTEIRMTLASNELRKPSMSTGAVADAVGYQSEAAFQRAFKSYMGLTPAQWRKGEEFSKADHSSDGQHEELRSATLPSRGHPIA